MKKLFSLCLICLLAMSAMAQRAAVMEFKAGVGISQADVDGLSGIFTTYFRPSGYTMIERTQIDRIIDEQKLQRSSLTESQMVRIGEILNLSKIVIGDVNIVMGQYNVDVRVINVESGTIAATEGATFAGSSYREGMKNLATKLASQIAIGAGPTVSAQSSSSSPTAKTRTKVESVYGYLYVFPNELGVFQSVPTNVIRQINSQGMHGYDEWRVPTNEELSLLRANGYLSGTQYMTKENPSGMVLLVTTGKSVAEKEAIRAEQARQAEIARQKEAERQAEIARQKEAERQAEIARQKEAERQAEIARQKEAERQAEQARQAEIVRQKEAERQAELLKYVDLGLPSGTCWRNSNEGGDNAQYTYNEAVSRFGNKLPTKDQFLELKNECEWTWTGNGYKVTGPNGNSIYLPAAGYRDCDGDVDGVGTSCDYWSSTLYDSDEAWILISNSSIFFVTYRSHCWGHPVRLVQ